MNEPKEINGVWWPSRMRKPIEDIIVSDKGLNDVNNIDDLMGPGPRDNNAYDWCCHPKDRVKSDTAGQVLDEEHSIDVRFEYYRTLACETHQKLKREKDISLITGFIIGAALCEIIHFFLR